VNSHQDYDTIRAEDIQKGDTIEFPSNQPDVKWNVEEARASKPPCNQPGVLWYVEELVGSMLGIVLADLELWLPLQFSLFVSRPAEALPPAMTPRNGC
jgi:hypothetical protein